MTPHEFVRKWQAADLKERAAAHSHFNDLCALLAEPTPTDADPKGEWYAFEKGATKTTGGEGWADVWKRGCFGWEYKGRGGKLDAAIDQLKRYALALENPPLLIACNLDRFRIVTNWTNAVSRVIEFDLDGLRDPENRQSLKWAFTEPEQLRPNLTRRHVTEIAAEKFAALARDLRAKGRKPQIVAHFVNRLVFCMFAEDIGLLPNAMFTRMLREAERAPAEFEPLCQALFGAMQTGGRLGFERVDWFDGGLFEDATTLPLTKPQLDLVLDAASLDWSEIDPSIMGTLFERGLDPDKRSQLGAHYTDAEKIMKIIEPVIKRPLEAEWAETKAGIEQQLARARSSKSVSARTRAHNQASNLFRGYLDRLRDFRVLDPACGSGNFLYLALQTIKDLEHRASIEAEALGMPREFPRAGPEQLLGIEINPYAAELARVSVWIGEIQWMQRNGFGIARSPILRPLDTIECRDALLNDDSTQAQWPAADVIIGNPPFLGDKDFYEVLGLDYATKLRVAYAEMVPRAVNLVSYWFAKASIALDGPATRVGLVATNMIRSGSNQITLRETIDRHPAFEAWSDEPWVVDGADVRVSIVCFGHSPAVEKRLNGAPASIIFADLTAGNTDVTRVCRLYEARGISFQGMSLVGEFEIDGEIAREWLMRPRNPDGTTNADVVKPIRSGGELTNRCRDRWVVDFTGLTLEQAMFYEAPFQHLIERFRSAEPIERRRWLTSRSWWIFERPRPELRAKLRVVDRYVATPKVSRHRFFVWLQSTIWPDNLIIAITRSDDTSIGLLESKYHKIWSLRKAAYIGVGNDPTYTPTSTFETFTFPKGMTFDSPANAYAADPRAQRIATAARRLNEMRENWLNPPDLVARMPEVVPGYPDRLLPKDEECGKELRKRTLTKLYNQRPAWLDNAHKTLDEAVAAAYGWPADLSDEEILRHLFELNQERAAAQDVPVAPTE